MIPAQNASEGFLFQLLVVESYSRFGLEKKKRLERKQSGVDAAPSSYAMAAVF